jgi:predicted O-methyltransferase YrrM
VNFDTIEDLVKGVEGWLTDREGRLLCDLASRCTGKGVIVEIGSWKGKSTIWLGRGSKEGNGVMIHAVDPHIGFPDVEEVYGKIWTFEEFKNNIAKAAVDDVVIPIIKTSEDAAKDFGWPVELIFIDGVHLYDYVKLDFELWFPKVVESGVMVFHDTTGERGPKRLVKERVFRSRNFKNVGFVDTITFAEKVARNSPTDRVRNEYVLLLKNVTEFAFRLHLPKSIRVAGRYLLGLLQG